MVKVLTKTVCHSLSPLNVHVRPLQLEETRAACLHSPVHAQHRLGLAPGLKDRGSLPPNQLRLPYPMECPAHCRQCSHCEHCSGRLDRHKKKKQEECRSGPEPTDALNTCMHNRKQRGPNTTTTEREICAMCESNSQPPPASSRRQGVCLTGRSLPAITQRPPWQSKHQTKSRMCVLSCNRNGLQ
jgi:hypothetical protein